MPDVAWTQELYSQMIRRTGIQNALGVLVNSDSPKEFKIQYATALLLKSVEKQNRIAYSPFDTTNQNENKETQS